MFDPMEAANLEHRSKDVVHLYLLGPPRTEWRNQPQVIPRRQVRGALYYLATQPRPVSSEYLRFLIWPDTPDSVSRRYLSHLLTHLRRALPDILVTDGAQFKLDPHRTWSDVLSFKRLVACFESPADIPNLRQAVQLYRGPLLDGVSFPGVEFEHVIERERLELERLYLKALRTLLDEEIALGNYDTAISYGHQYLSVDELDEEVYRLLMGLYAIDGNRASALNQFKCLIEVLDRELGLDPLPDTVALYRDVLRGRSIKVQGPEVEGIAPSLSATDVPLVERQEIEVAGFYSLTQVGGRLHTRLLWMRSGARVRRHRRTADDLES